MGVCLADEHACKANNYSSYRFRDFTHLAEYVTRYDIRCFNATRDDETGGVRLEVH